MAMRVEANDDRLSWPGAVSLERGDGWVQPWRIPHGQRALFPPDMLRDRTAMAAGVRLTFRTTSAAIHGDLALAAESSHVDLAVDGDIVASHPVGGKTTFAFDGLPTADKLVEHRRVVRELLTADERVETQVAVAAKPANLVVRQSTRCDAVSNHRRACSFVSGGCYRGNDHRRKLSPGGLSR